MTRFKVLTVCLATAIFFTFAWRQAWAAEPSLLLNPADKTVATGEEFSVDIFIDTGGQSVGGAGAKLKFDQSKLRAEIIELGEIFADYPAAIIDNNNGLLTISGISASPQDLFQGVGIFASVGFTALTPGTTAIEFNFEPGSTTDSNIATLYPPGDILTAVNILQITVNQGGQAELDQPATPEPETNNLVEEIWQTVKANLPWQEPEVSRPGRVSSTKLAADGPIVRQDPITDTDQSQPKFTASLTATATQPSAIMDIITSKEFIISAAVGLTLITGLLIFRRLN